MMTVQQISKRLNCSRALIYALIESGQLGCYRIGLGKQGGVRVSEEQLQHYLKDREQAPGISPEIRLKHIRIT
jgi:excisionase family DNA binding protein